MNKLSLDEVFCVMEFLSVQDLPSALLVCKEWHQLDKYEPFWKAVMSKFLISEINSQFLKLKGKLVIKNWKQLFDDDNIQRVLNLENDKKEKLSLMSALKSSKLNSEFKSKCVFMVEKTVFTFLVSSFENHILKDKTASRVSLQFYSKANGSEITNEKSMIGNRFKYLMKKQIDSHRKIILSSYVKNVHLDGRANDHFVAQFLTKLMGREFIIVRRNTHDNPFDEENSEENLRDCVFDILFKYGECMGNLDNLWLLIMDKCFRSIHKVVPNSKELMEILNRLFTFYKGHVKFDWISTVFIHFEYYRPYLDEIKEILLKNGTDNSLSDIVLNVCVSMSLDDRVEIFVNYFKYLENFVSKESISEFFSQSIQYSIFLAQLSSDEHLLNKFLDEYPIPLNHIRLRSLMFYSHNIANFITSAEQRGFSFSLSQFQDALRNASIITNVIHIIRLLLERFEIDIYEIERQHKFFNSFLATLLVLTFEEIVQSFETIFRQDPIDLEKMCSLFDRNIWNSLAAIIKEMIKKEDPIKVIDFLEKRFKQKVLNIETLPLVLYADIWSPINKLLYEHTMMTLENNDERPLDDYVKQLLINDDNLVTFKNTKFWNYEKTDPLYFMALSNFCNGVNCNKKM